MGSDNLVFMEVLEWFDDTGRELAHRLPQHGSGEIKFGAQVIVRDSQAAVFYSNGVACDALGPGRHTMITKNVPILTKVLALPWGFKSPFRAESYFVNLKVFTGLKWGTRDPVAFRDSELGLVRLRAHGILNVQVTQPVLFVNKLVGTDNSYGVEELQEYVNDVVVSRLNDHLGENLDTLLDLPSRYDEIGRGLAERLEADLARFGLALRGLYVNAITPPRDVQQALDDRSRLGAVGDKLQDLMQLKMAMALEKGAEQTGGGVDSGLAMGMGLMVPGLLGSMANFSGGQSAAQAKPSEDACPECGLPIEQDARFCRHCGHQILVLRKCSNCYKNLSPKANFCPACGTRADIATSERICSDCGEKARPESIFCNQCGERLG